MARIKLDIPTQFHFQTRIPIRITDINYGGHLGNDALLSLLHEARIQFFQSIGCSEKDFFGTGIIMGDVAIIYRSEGFYGNTLNIEVAVTDLSRSSFDLFYRVSDLSDKREIAIAKTGMLSFDYEKRKVVSVPDAFAEKFSQ